eukprot:1271156-Rhodomonas_salina.1
MRRTSCMRTLDRDRPEFTARTVVELSHQLSTFSPAQLGPISCSACNTMRHSKIGGSSTPSPVSTRPTRTGPRPRAPPCPKLRPTSRLQTNLLAPRGRSATPPLPRVPPTTTAVPALPPGNDRWGCKSVPDPAVGEASPVPQRGASIRDAGILTPSPHLRSPTATFRLTIPVPDVIRSA